jgi:hypothetical protein
LFAVYDVNDGTEYRFIATDPFNAMEKMLYMQNLSKLNVNARITETAYGYLLTHDNNEFWTKK